MDDTEDQSNSPKLKEARHIVASLLKAINITEAPVVLNDICKQIKKTSDLTVHGTDRLSGNIDAVLKRVDNKVFILYNTSKPINRQRFSIAHELGHFYMGHVFGNSSIDLGSKNNDEIEANHFAAYLLMPPTLLRADIKAGTRDIAVLSKRYQVSEDAMWWQIDKAGLLRLL